MKPFDDIIELGEFASIEEETLTDNSHVYNVRVNPDVVFSCVNKNHAIALYEQIEKCIDVC